MPKAMRWGSRHTDKYVYDHGSGKWIKAACSLDELGMYCTAPAHLPRGTKFSYNCCLTETEAYYYEEVITND